MKISKYNINYGNLDQSHIDLLKKQIQEGNDIPVRYYVEENEKYIIDGGHAFTAYSQLGKEPPYLIEVKFTTPEDMVALSRHCNVNRIQQTPVSYAESIVKEVELRLNIQDKEVKSVFIKYEKVKERGDNSVGVDVYTKERIIEDIFSNEPITPITFRITYLPLLNLPEPIKKKVDKGELGISHAGELAKIKNKEKQKKVAKIVEEDDLSYRDTKEIVGRIEKRKESPEYAAYQVHEQKAMKRLSEAPEHKIKLEKAETPPLPEGKFNIIYADPPWEYDFSVSDSRAIESHYSTMSLEEICEFREKGEFDKHIADDAILFLWVPVPKDREGQKVIEAWNFEYKTGMVWVKDKIGMGYYIRNKHELLMIATRGLPELPKSANRPESVINAPRTKHSKKPEAVYEIIEKMYPNGAYLELFARSQRKGWTSWGAEIEND